jgi:hypothetical protein
MYVILINDDNTMYGSHKERIMQRSKCVDELVFIVDPIYRNKYDMTDASVLMEYVLPVSREYKTEYLTLSNERYKDCFLQYKLPIDTNLTKEAGTIELQLTFAYADMGANGNIIQRVRKISPTTIEITPISAWSDLIPDAALSSLDQRLIKLDASMRAMNDYLDVIDSNKVDNLVYDEKEETLQLSANGKGVGDKVSVRDMIDDGIPVVDLNSSSSGDSNTDNDNNCDCEADVVEF